MNQYLAETVVNLPIAFLDDDGNELSVSKAVYRITDQDGREILPYTNFDIANNKLTIEAAHNAIVALDIDSITAANKYTTLINQLRVVEFNITLSDGNTISHDVPYIIYPRERLIAGLNSFQSISQAMIVSNSLHDVAAFLSSSTAKRIAALTEAYMRISRFEFVDSEFGLSNKTAAWFDASSINLDRLSPNDFKKLSDRFRAALNKAQVIEANVIAGGGDVIERMRQSGLTSQTIGETHESYRSSAPANTILSKETLNCLSEFLVKSKRITRV